MAIVLEANYSKKIGLPGYSSHQFALTIRTELSDLNQVETENERLYALLQASVDREIQEIGYLPKETPNGNGYEPAHGHANGDVWKCSAAQKTLIETIIAENALKTAEIESLARQRFNCPVKLLNKMQASNLIDELLERYGKKNDNSRFARRGFGKATAR